eukprot:TRINITY_DN55779_c0_g1_i1.p1 TRINITY_DN55779_c0_g1~~TRINITY_DN55779_c0_g1_i1.p1  ORF type:complete len:379 (-),score=56.39 TRINITY_DN55779_c0_g1_i1:96-1232(-)
MAGRISSLTSAPTAPPTASMSPAQAAEMKRLKAENARLQKRLDAGAERWGAVLMQEIRNEEPGLENDERRIHSLKSELCLALRRRRQLEDAVRARHAGLQRLASTSGSAKAHVESSLVDGASEIHARRGEGPNTASLGPVTAEAALEAEHLSYALRAQLATAATCRAGDQVSSDLAAVAAAAASRLSSCSTLLLKHAPQLPPAQAQQAACAQRHLRRMLGTADKQRQSFPSAPGVSLQTDFGASHSRFDAGSTLPDALLQAWCNVLEAARDEQQEARAKAEASVASMAEASARWTLQAAALRKRLDSGHDCILQPPPSAEAVQAGTSGHECILQPPSCAEAVHTRAAHEGAGQARDIVTAASNRSRPASTQSRPAWVD